MFATLTNDTRSPHGRLGSKLLSSFVQMNLMNHRDETTVDGTNLMNLVSRTLLNKKVKHTYQAKLNWNMFNV
jgi:hypothetical protein